MFPLLICNCDDANEFLGPSKEGHVLVTDVIFIVVLFSEGRSDCLHLGGHGFGILYGDLRCVYIGHCVIDTLVILQIVVNML